ncbi:MAG: hypothetical protein K2I60_02000, partial [Oscillospiraceae bacterium]|nr:hypothetical protein [Oscillospiraceae bacterium]
AAEEQKNLQTAESPTKEFAINNKDDFSKFMTTPEYWENNYKIILACDIDMQDTMLDSIENFNGQFDGGEHNISNLSFKCFVKNNCGTISGVKFNSGKLVNGSKCGFVEVNEESGVIDNCSVVMNSTDIMVAGFVGENRGKIINSETTISVKNNNNYLGGFVGENYGTIENCTANGNVNGKVYVGGFVGINNGTITNCSSRGNVYGVSVGGFVGENGNKEGKGIIINCTATGSVKGDMYTGGFVARNSCGNITNCTAKGDVNTRIPILGPIGLCLGGFVGWNKGIITKCIATGTVTGRNISLDSFTGQNDGEIEECIYVANSLNIYII